MNRTVLIHLAILLFLLAIVFGFNIFAGGTITSPQHLAVDLASPPESPQDWLVQDWPVVKYRALFRIIVRGTWAALFPPTDAWAFYVVFVAWSFFFFCCTLVALYGFLRILEFDARWSFVGCLFFLASPPVLLAYKYPVYTREDVLAYFLLVLGLFALARSRSLLVGLISVAAVLTRETTLILPLTYFLTSSDRWLKRILIVSLPFLAQVGIRIMWGLVFGNNLESSLLNFQHPFETASFMFCVFGALWLPSFLALHNRRREGRQSNPAWRMLTLSGPFILAVLLGAAIFLSRAREARIAFILFPWILPFALDWARSNIGYLQTLASSQSYVVFSCLIFGAISAFVLVFHVTNPDLMRFYLADFKNGYWLFLGTLHLSVTLAVFLPMLRRQIKPQRI